MNEPCDETPFLVEDIGPVLVLALTLFPSADEDAVLVVQYESLVGREYLGELEEFHQVDALGHTAERRHPFRKFLNVFRSDLHRLVVLQNAEDMFATKIVFLDLIVSVDPIHEVPFRIEKVHLDEIQDVHLVAGTRDGERHLGGVDRG